MNDQQTLTSGSLVYYRLIALWALNEAMLGGVIHGLKIPVSGLVVGSCAVICISLIAWYVPRKGAIIKATIIVAVFKMMLSPQAPPPAYIAVFFQGLMGELLFFNKRWFKLSCLLLAVLSLVESGLQRILVLTIVYGNDLWKVINDSINRLTKQKTAVNYSLLIGGGYVFLHLIAGFIVGWWASLLPNKISKWNEDQWNKIVLANDKTAIVPVSKKRRRGLKRGLFIAWIILILLYAQSIFRIGDPLLPRHISLKILVRSVIIVLTWYFILGPLLKQLLHYWLQKKQAKAGQDISAVWDILPSTRHLIVESWKRSAGSKGLRRIIACAKAILVNALNPVVPGRVFILTGPVQTGKTTSLVKWSEQRDDVFGILTPVVNGKRSFMNVRVRHLFDMEAGDEEKDKLIIGRFAFSKNNFDKAIHVIRDAMNKKGWLIVDEVGPMELRGDGFREVVKEVISAENEDQRIVLVVREGLVEKVKESFQIKNAIVINRVSDLQY